MSTPQDETPADARPAPDFDLLLGPEADWSPLPVASAARMHTSFVSGDPHGDRIRIRYYERVGDEHLHGKAWFGLGCSGPPGHAHGGSSAALLDDLMGTVCWRRGHPVVAAKIEISFRRPLPLLRMVRTDARVVRSEGRRVHAVARLLVDGEVMVEGEGIFVRIDDKLTAKLGGAAVEWI